MCQHLFYFLGTLGGTRQKKPQPHIAYTLSRRDRHKQINKYKRSERCEKYSISNGDMRESGWRSLAGVVREILSGERKFDQDPKVGCLQPLEDPGEKCFRQRN